MVLPSKVAAALCLPTGKSGILGVHEFSAVTSSKEVEKFSTRGVLEFWVQPPNRRDWRPEGLEASIPSSQASPAGPEMQEEHGSVVLQVG